MYYAQSYPQAHSTSVCVCILCELYFLSLLLFIFNSCTRPFVCFVSFFALTSLGSCIHHRRPPGRCPSSVLSSRISRLFDLRVHLGPLSALEICALPQCVSHEGTENLTQGNMAWDRISDSGKHLTQIKREPCVCFSNGAIFAPDLVLALCFVLVGLFGPQLL